MNESMSALNDTLYNLIGEAITIQKELGDAHQEIVYHKMLLTRLRKAGYKVEDRPKIKIHDEAGNVIKTYRPDIRVKDEDVHVLIEIKADPGGLQSSHHRQVRAYLSVSPDDQAGLLINFGEWPLGQERIYPKRNR
jgi:GxxExxY protein